MLCSPKVVGVSKLTFTSILFFIILPLATILISIVLQKILKSPTLVAILVFAGYKDWFLQQYRRPGYTVEAGIGNNPLPISQFNEIYTDNLGILVLSMVL